MVAHLTIDANGVRGDEPGFDKNNVKTYGLSSEGSGGGGWGQTQWSAFTGSAGWQVTDKNPWGSKFNLDAAGVAGHPVVVLRAGRQGLHAELRGDRRRQPDRHRQADPVRHRGHGPQRLLDDLDVHQPHRRPGSEAPHRHRADADRADRQAGVDVQRPGRLHHHAVPAAGERGQVGQVHVRRGMPEHHRRVRHRLPGPAERHGSGDRVQQERAATSTSRPSPTR